MSSSHLVLGGARSGKSRFAVQCHASARRVVFVATATAGDADMAARIARHRAERPAGWSLVEEPTALAACLSALERARSAVLVDCLTLWVSNRMLRGDDDRAILGEADEIAGLVERGVFEAITVVSNEVGEGVHPPTADGLRFRDLLGLVNQAIAAACERVTLMVAGLPLTIKDAARPGHAPEAP